MHLITPVQLQERAQILDVLRGIALAGIMLNNIYGLSGYGLMTDEMRQQLKSFSSDSVLNFLQITFIEGKFYSLFSLLFGIGFSIILIRNEARGINPLKIFYRRLGVLLLIGAAHLFFFWEGDILVLYALIGFVLPLFRKCSDKNLLLWATLLLLSPIIIDAIRLWLQWGPGDSLQHFAEDIDAKNGIVGEEWRTCLFKDGSGWHEWRTYQETAFMYRFSSLLNNNRIPKVLGMFLIGFYVGRKRMYENLVQYKPFLKKLLLWGLVIGLPFSMAMAFFENDKKSIPANVWGMADTISYAFGVVPLSLAYVAFICLIRIKAKGLSRLNVFAPVGRMALTNYLMQTVIAIALFYGAALGFGQKFGLVYLFPIAISIYILQVIYSNMWFRYFEYGPIEWIWRQLTYGKRLALRNKKNEEERLQVVVNRR